jgi:hypothetical protein
VVTRHKKGAVLETPCVTSAIAMGGGILTVCGLTLGLATNNPALMGISLSIGAGGALGWLVAGGVTRRRS